MEIEDIMLTREDLAELSSCEQEGPCLSLHMPTHRAGRETRQDPIRFKNLLNEAEQRLDGEGDHAKAMLEDLRKLLDDEDFWRHQSAGLAVFAKPGANRIEHVPVTLEEGVHVGDRFYVRPVLPMLQRDDFYLLTLSQDGCRLYHGDHAELTQIELDSDSMSIEAVVPDRRTDGELQFRSASSPAQQRAGDAPVYHGHNQDEENEEADLRRFLKEVDRCVCDELNGQDAMLVLAGVDRVMAGYEQLSECKLLCDCKIHGAADDKSADQLREAALAMVQEKRQAEVRGQLDRFGAASDGPLACSTPNDVTMAATRGQVDTLFVARDGVCQGAVDRTTGESIPDNGDDDLIEYAAAMTLRNGGQVRVLPLDAMPAGAPMAALLRYEVEA